MSLRALAVILLFALAAILAGWNNSATADEPYHITASWSMVHDGFYDLNPEHPPLAKTLSGIALVACHPAPPPYPPGKRLTHLNRVIHAFLYENRLPPMTLLRIARLPLILFFIGTLIIVFLWSRERFGNRGAWTSLLILGSQPLLLGHAQVIHTDVAAAFTWTLTLYLLYRLIMQPSILRGAALGGALGLALLAKFSAVYLVLFVILIILIRYVRKPSKKLLASLPVALLITFIVIPAGYAPMVRNSTPQMERTMIHETMSLFPEGGKSREALLDRFVPFSIPLTHFLLGLSYVELTNQRGQSVNYLFGHRNLSGFLLYFPAAFLLKSTFPFLLLLFLALLRGRPKEELFLTTLLSVLLYLSAAIFSSYNIGARHLLPLYPLLAVLCGRAAEGMKRGLVTLILIVGCIIPIVSFPHYISHFNLLAGGRWMGYHYLADSNLDWGQEWFRMARAVRKEGIDYRDTTIVVIGTGDPLANMPGSADFFAKGIRGRRYVALSKQVDLVGAETLRLLGYRRESKALSDLLTLLHTRAQRLFTVGGSLDLYRLPPPAREK